MLNLNCVICSDLFNPSDDVHVTTCGHMFHNLCLRQWLERSKTCPQCRNKCSDRNVIRLYFNVANLDISQIDIGSLQEQLENAQLQIQCKERELRKSADEVASLKNSQKKCMKTISGLEKKLDSKNFLIESYEQQLKALQTDNRIMQSLRDELAIEKAQVEILKGASSILTSSVEDAEKILSNERDVRKLAVWGSALKRELQEYNTKKNHIHSMLIGVKENLRRELEAKKKLVKQVDDLKDALFNATEKLKILEEESKSNKTDPHTIPAALTDMHKIIYSPLISNERRSTISPTIKKSVQIIEESNSPYLNIKSSGIGLLPVFKRPQSQDVDAAPVIERVSSFKISPVKVNVSATAGALRKVKSDISEAYPLLKKQRFGLSTNTSANTTMRRDHLVPNGFGGMERADPFARGLELNDVQNLDEQKTAAKKPTWNLSNRLKAGKLRQFQIAKRS